MRHETQDGELTVWLEGRIDSKSAPSVQDEIDGLLAQTGATRLKLDTTELEYISSAGLRMVLHFAKTLESLQVTEVSPEVYEVFDMSGFTDMIDVQKRLRTVSLDGLRQIGAGANGRVYRLGDEQIVKVFNPITSTTEKIWREKDVARTTFVLGIPSAISFDVVRAGDSLGVVYEFVDAHTLGETVADQPERAQEYGRRMGELLRQLHETEVPEDSLPDARLALHGWVDIAERSGCYGEEIIAKLRKLVDSIPVGSTFVHGDFHPANIMVTDDDELLLIDVGDASAGDPLADLLGSYQIMRLVTRTPGAAELYTGMSSELLQQVWNAFIHTYFDQADDDEIAAIERRLEFYALIRSIPGITFSTAVPEHVRARLSATVSNAFLQMWDAFGMDEATSA